MDSSNPYASPQTSGAVPAPESEVGPWRSGNLLVVMRGSNLPQQCVKCNVPTDDRKGFNLAWHPPIAYVALLLGLCPFVIVALITQKKMPVDVGICLDHRRKRRDAVLIGWLGALAGIALIFLGATAKGNAVGWIIIGGVALLLAAMIYGIVVARIIWPKRIDKHFAWIKGACPEYLQGLPEFPG